MHLQWVDAGAMGTNAIVGGAVPFAAGFAFADKWADTDNVKKLVENVDILSKSLTDADRTAGTQLFNPLNDASSTVQGSPSSQTVRGPERHFPALQLSESVQRS